MVNNPKITQSIYYFKENKKYKPLYSHKYMKDYGSTGRKSYIIYRKTKNLKDKPFYGRFYRKSEILTKPNKNYSKKKIRTRRARRRTQRGGLLPICATGICFPAAMKVAGAGAAAFGAAKYFSRRSSSEERVVNGKKSVKRKEVYKLNKNGKITEKEFTQRGTKLNLAGKKSQEDSLEEATEKFNASVKRCVKGGFKKC